MSSQTSIVCVLDGHAAYPKQEPSPPSGMLYGDISDDVPVANAVIAIAESSSDVRVVAVVIVVAVCSVSLHGWVDATWYEYWDVKSHLSSFSHNSS